jgi:hypothetical protein
LKRKHLEEAAPSDVPEIGKVEGLEVQLDLPDDNLIRVPPQFNRRERGVAKEEMKAPVAPGVRYYSVLDNAEAHDGYRITGYHDKIPAALSPVFEMVQEVHDAFSFDYIHEEILMHFEKRKRKKLKKKLKPVDLYHHWLETEVADVIFTC